MVLLGQFEEIQSGFDCLAMELFANQDIFGNWLIHAEKDEPFPLHDFYSECKLCRYVI